MKCAVRGRLSAGNLFACSFAVTLVPTIGLALLVGCSRTPTAAINAPESSPRQRLADLSRVYQQAKSYQDAGELRFLVDGAPEDEFRSIPFSVALERPNKIRLHVMDTTTVADSQQVRSIAQSLAGQVLVRTCGPDLKLPDIYGDDLLAKAMAGQLGASPVQLALLLNPDAMNEMLRDNTAAQLSDSEFQGRKCRRIGLTGPDGKSVLWIDVESGLLVKYEFPLDEIRKRFPLAALWAEFRGARVNDPVDPVAFQMEVPSEIKLVKKFVLPAPVDPPAMLGKKVEDFTFVDLQGSAIGQQSLAGKVVVIDLWATWCGWCFEGLPLVNKVYEQFKENDKVAFLAVSKDDVAVTNAAIEESFAKKELKIPIVRDQQQITDKVFQLEGLPTTIVLGPDGTVQDYHIGYDPNVADTLPKKIEKLLAGENLAQQALDAHQQAKQEYEQRLAEVLFDPAASTEPEVARTPSTVE